jgi:carbonic anhydrase/acetyltransferase-like protein (isoleucine patch superfamily)
VRFHVGSADVLEVVVDPEEQVVELDLAKALVGDETPKLSLPRHPVMTVHHWAHLLWANQAAGASEVRRVPRWLGVLRVLWAVLRAMSLNKWKVLAKLNTVGKGCDIHPTAVVEGCNLGDNVTIGAHARVLFSRLDDGVEVMTGAHVEASTLGARSTVAQASGMRGCVLYPDAFASFPMMQATVLGREVLTTAASYAIDLNLERDIRVLHDGALVSAGTRFLGAAIGHRCRIGTGLWIASGREVPNDTILVRDPDFVMARTPTEAGRTWTLRGGRAVALTSKSQEERPTPEE